jgi:aminoglycoside phosphotransferase family enzyme
MLDHVIQSGSVASADIEAVVQQLCDFYRRSRPVALDGAEYRREFAAGIAEHRLELERAGYALPMAEIERICEALLAILAQASLFDARAAGRIVEGHGDLRPERICLEREPQIIACVAFSRRLRTLDPADELALLALECERLGAPQVGAQLLAAFRERCADATPAALASFYRGYRALVRAAHAIRHLERRLPDRAEQIARAKQYVELAAGDTR